MAGDTVEYYKGREVDWAAACALDGVECGGDSLDAADVGDLVDGVWEFVEQSCEEAGQPVPDRADVIAIVLQWLRDSAD